MSIQDITLTHLEHLISQLADEGVAVGIEDIHYSLMNREEWIYIDTDLVYPTEDLPDQFGVYVTPEGNAITTEIDNISPRRKDKARRLLELFRSTYVDATNAINQLTTLEV